MLLLLACWTTAALAADRDVAPTSPASELVAAFAAGDRVRVGGTLLPAVDPAARPLPGPEEAPALWDDRPLVLWVGPGDWRLGWWPHGDFAVGSDPELLEQVLVALRTLVTPDDALHVEVRPDTPAEEVARVLAAVDALDFREPLDLVVTAPAWAPGTAARPVPERRGMPLRSTTARPTDSGAYVFENVGGLGSPRTIEAADVLAYQEDCRKGYCVVVLVAADANYLLYARTPTQDLTHRWIRNVPVTRWEGPSLGAVVPPAFRGTLRPFVIPATARKAAEGTASFFKTDADVDRTVLTEREQMLRERCVAALGTRAYLRETFGAWGQDAFVRFVFSVAATGEVLDVTIEPGAVRNLPFEGCVSRTMRQIGFPKERTGAAYEVRYSVHFNVE